MSNSFISATNSSVGEEVLLLIVPVRWRLLSPIIPAETTFASTSKTLGVLLFLAEIITFPISFPFIKISLISKSISGSRLFLFILMSKFPFAVPRISILLSLLVKAKTFAISRFFTSPIAEKSLADLKTASFKNNSLASE